MGLKKWWLRELWEQVKKWDGSIMSEREKKIYTKMSFYCITTMLSSEE